MECSVFIYTDTDKEFLQVVNSKQYGWSFRKYEKVINTKDKLSCFKCILRLPDSKVFSILNKTTSLNADDLISMINKYHHEEAKEYQNMIREELGLNHTKLKKFKLVISSGYYRVCNTSIEVSAQNESDAEELAYEMINRNDSSYINWGLCPVDENDVFLQTEDITKLN